MKYFLLKHKIVYFFLNIFGVEKLEPAMQVERVVYPRARLVVCMVQVRGDFGCAAVVSSGATPPFDPRSQPS